MPDHQDHQDQMDNPDNQEAQDQLDHPDQPAIQENQEAMDIQDNQENLENPEVPEKKVFAPNIVLLMVESSSKMELVVKLFFEKFEKYYFIIFIFIFSCSW